MLLRSNFLIGVLSWQTLNIFCSLVLLLWLNFHLGVSLLRVNFHIQYWSSVLMKCLDHSLLSSFVPVVKLSYWNSTAHVWRKKFCQHIQTLIKIWTFFPLYAVWFPNCGHYNGRCLYVGISMQSGQQLTHCVTSWRCCWRLKDWCVREGFKTQRSIRSLDYRAVGCLVSSTSSYALFSLYNS